MTAVLRWIGASLMLALFAAKALAPDPGLKLAQLIHERWTPAEGAPAPVYAIAQTPDGYLWLGAGNGLFRFDGVRFEKISGVAGKPLLHVPIFQSDRGRPRRPVGRLRAGRRERD